MTKTTKILIGAGALAAVVVLAVALGGPKDDASLYSWDTIAAGDIRETISASGEIQAKTKINIGTSVMGEIKVLHVKDGQDVKAGDLLVTIDHESLRQATLQAQAMLDASRKEASRLQASRARSEENFARMDALFRQKLISDEEYRQARLARESAALNHQSGMANVRQYEASVAAAKTALEKSVLRAPISGRVTGLKAEKGETAIPGMSNVAGATLMVVSDMSEVIAEIKVNESEVVRCRVGQSAQVSVESLPGRVFPGKVYEVASAAEKSGQDANMYKVKVGLDMKAQDVAQLRPGMSARAVILTAEARQVLRVPLQAVLEREGSLEEAQKKGLLSPEGRSVVMVVENGRARERTVKTGIASTAYFEVKEGLKAGEKVLTGPVRKLKEMKDRDSVNLRKRSDAELEAEAQKRKGASR
jgi:HlyD family secretion protein